MIVYPRQRYNEHFDAKTYAAFLQQFEVDFPGQLDFRVAETPVFVPKGLKEQIIQAGEDIIDGLLDPAYKARTERAIPPSCFVPDEDEHPSFLILDYAVCRDDQGRLYPTLIELQGFANLFPYYVNSCLLY